MSLGINTDNHITLINDTIMFDDDYDDDFKSFDGQIGLNAEMMLSVAYTGIVD